MKAPILKMIALFAILISGGEALAAIPPRGLVLYTRPPADYVLNLEFVTLTHTSVAYTTVLLLTGKKEEIPRGGIVAVINYPPEVPTETLPQDAAAATQAIKKARSKYPQFSVKLDAAAAKWTNSLEVYRQRQRMTVTTPSVKPYSVPVLEVEGIKYTDATLSSFDGKFVGITHSAGVSKLPLEKLSATQIAALNSTSKTEAIVDPIEVTRQAQGQAANPDAFVALLARYPSRFPLTALSLRLRSKDWAQAQSIASSGMMAIHGENVWADSPLYLVVAAQAQSGDLNGAFAACNALHAVDQRAMAHRILVEWCVIRGNLERAEAACASIAVDMTRLPEGERKKLKVNSDPDSLSAETLGAVVQQGIAHRVLVKGLAAAGRVKDAWFWVREIRDASTLAHAYCSLLEAKIIAHAPDADEFGSTLLEKLGTAGRAWDQVHVFETQSKAFSSLKNWDAAIDPLDRAILVVSSPNASIPSDAAKEMQVGLLAKKARLYRQIGDEDASRKALAEALGVAEDARAYRAALDLVGVDAKQVKDCVAKIRQSIAEEAAKGGKNDIGELLSLSQAQRRAHEIEAAQETLKVAAAILAGAKQPELQAEALGEEQARNGDFANARQTLGMLSNPEDKLRLQKALGVEQARQGQLKEALTIFPQETLTDENLDALGVAVINIFDKIELFPAKEGVSLNLSAKSPYPSKTHKARMTFPGATPKSNAPAPGRGGLQPSSGLQTSGGLK